MSRVFLVEPNSRYNLSEAAVFGELVYLSQVPLNPFDTETTIKICLEKLQKYEFDYENDFICMTGQSLTVAILQTVASSMFPFIKLLMFDARTSNYKERLLNVQIVKEQYSGQESQS